MEAFFLPHSVITTSPTLEFMRWRVGTYAFSLGILAAFISGIQVYATKVLKRNAALSWMYSRIRHPFYLSLAVAGFGLLTIWPRIIILILYLGMLIMYFFLARFEEKQVEAIALRDPRDRSALEKEPGAAFTPLLLPADYGMMNMFADVGTDHSMFSRLSAHRFKYLLSFVFPFCDHHQKNRIMGSPQENYKVVFSRVDEPGRPEIAVSKVVDLTAKMTPVVIAEIKGPSPTLQDVVIPPRRSFWGDITMPMF